MTMKKATMKRFITALSLAVFFAALAPTLVEAKRLGGGGSSGMQRSMPARTAPDSAPAKPATPAAAQNAVPGSPAAAAAAPKRSWMGPLAGLAAGLGIAALMSHLGMGAAFGEFLTIALLVLVAFFAFRFLMARFGPGAKRAPAMAPQGMQFAGAAGNSSMPMPASMPASVSAGSASIPTAAAAASLPAGFDSAGFERIAKMIFIRMQAANDTADLTDLRAFTTPEMFAAVKLELQERGANPNQTDVVKIDAQVLEFAEEAASQVVSVRFHGLIREEVGGVAAPFDEVWHLVKPVDGSREWAIAGIQQTA
jgi:predicted lipid-binding transport protein (Tim44 family)